MRLPCLAVLLAAVLLHGAAADNKCDPSSTNCAGPLSVSAAGAPAAKKAASSQYYSGDSEGPSYDEYGSGREDSYGSGEYDYEGTFRYRQEGGLEGAKVWGGLYFNTETVDYEATNYFDEEEGYVPDGYGNSHDGSTCAITVYGKEFAYEGHSNHFTVDIDAYGNIELKNIVKKDGKNNAMVIVLKSPAFVGYSILTEISDNFGGSPGGANATISGNKITIRVPEITGLTDGQEQVARFKISACSSGDCCIDGQYKKHHTVCRAAAGPCDKEEYCTGESSTCPTDGFKHKGWVCKHPVSFCDAPDVCTGNSTACPEVYEPEYTPCPWAKDCESCTDDSQLSYTRTHPMAKDYKGGDGYGYNSYGAPSHPNWPNCVGKCDGSGMCAIHPQSATCCREDEEAYPFESDEYYGYGDESYSGEDGYYSGEGDSEYSEMQAMGGKDAASRVNIAAGYRTSATEGQPASTTSRKYKNRHSSSNKKRRYGKRRADKGDKDHKDDKEGDGKKEDAKSPWIHGKEDKEGDSYKKYKHTKYGGKYGKDSKEDKDKEQYTKYIKGEEKKTSKPEEEKKTVKEEKPEAEDKYADKHYKYSTKHEEEEKHEAEKKKEEEHKAKEVEEEKEQWFRYKEQKEKEEQKEQEAKATKPEPKKEAEATKPEPKKEAEDVSKPRRRSDKTKTETPKQYEKYEEKEENYFGGKKEQDAPAKEEEEYFGGKNLHPGHGPEEEEEDYKYGRPGYGPRDGPDGYPRDGPEGYHGRDGPEDYYGREGPANGRDGPEGYGKEGYGKEGHDGYEYVRPGYKGREYEGKGPGYGKDGPGGYGKDKGEGPGYGKDGPDSGYGKYDGKYDFYGKEEGYGEEEAMPLSCWAAV